MGDMAWVRFFFQTSSLQTTDVFPVVTSLWVKLKLKKPDALAGYQTSGDRIFFLTYNGENLIFYQHYTP